MAVARAHGKSLVFKLTDSGSTVRDISNDVDTVQGLPGPVALGDVTAGGDGGTRFVPGLENSPITLSGPYNSTATTGAVTILGALYTSQRTATSPVTAIQFGPEGSTSGAPKYTANCWISDYKTDVQVANATKWTATLQVDNVVTITTW